MKSALFHNIRIGSASLSPFRNGAGVDLRCPRSLGIACAYNGFFCIEAVTGFL